MSSKTGLQDLLVQLARFYRANEASISADQVSKCLELLPATESSALDRLFSLWLHRKTNRFISCHAPPARRDDVPSVSSRASKAGAQQSSPISHARQQRSPEVHPARALIPEANDCQADVSFGRPRPEESDPCSQSTTPGSDIDDQNTTATPAAISPTPPATGVPSPLHIAAEDDTFSTITFSPRIRRLLEDCKTDRGGFLRAIGEAKAAFPTGQGWEAAIATKEDNADMRDCMKIYHRFECYNIYRHVVEAGFHTGTHWIRDLRTALANKLCQEFPHRFHNQKAANKSLNWVDHGCKYREWADNFRNNPTDLGYLIALPLDVPHSAYTSRCTKEGKHASVIKLKSLGIDDLVRDLELSALGDHIAATLRDMTGRKRKDVSGEIMPGSRKSPRMTSSPSLLPSNARTAQPGQNPTPPESLAASTDGNNTLNPLGQPTSVSICRSIADDYAVPYNDPFSNMDLSPSPYSGLFDNAGYNAAMDQFDELYRDANYTDNLSQFRATPPIHVQHTNFFS
ncbi:hypothetical protein IFM51744_01043 [Aspergillus udagawae]|nr:hypothetical protein IFM51744_01043 [Aspergillus udagawae]